MGSDSGQSRFQELVDQLGRGTTAQEYTSADDDLCTCTTFEDTDQWREELLSMVCNEGPFLAKRMLPDDDDSENEEEPEPESSITTYDEALCVFNNLLLFLRQHSEEQLSGTMFKVVTELRCINLKQSVMSTQSSILKYFAQ